MIGKAVHIIFCATEYDLQAQRKLNGIAAAIAALKPKEAKLRAR